MTAQFTLNSVSYRFPNGSLAIDDLTLSITAGSRVVLLGANGAGKSTLLQLLGGLRFATEGDVCYNWERLTERALGRSEFRRSFRKDVGFLFQNPDVQLFCPTVREEVAFGPLQFFSREEAAERTYGALHAMGIEHLADEAPFALSGGEKRKVTLATVLVMDPKVLLLDEPTISLDASTTDFLLDWLQEFAQGGAKTIITATHDMALAPELGRDAVVLTPCHKRARTGNLAALLEDAEFLRQMNLIGRRTLQPNTKTS